MTVYNADLFSYDNVAEQRKERKYGWKSTFAIYYKERYMVDFQAICKVPNTRSAFVCMSDDYHFVATVDQLSGKLVDVALDSSWLRIEEVAHHSDVVWHLEESSRKPSPHRYVIVRR